MNVRRILVVAILLVCVYAIFLVETPFGPATETFVEIAPGSGSRAMAGGLERAGIVRSAACFLLLRVFHPGAMRAGEYRFDHPTSMIEVYKRLRRGDVYTRALTIPEGFNLFDIAQAAEKAGLGSRGDFLAAARGRVDLIADLSPHAPSLEGFLFPATYRFPRRATPDQMVTAMVRRFRQAAGQLGLGPGVSRAVILASLIEKEVGVDAERPIVAGVFENRLGREMPLETDPAVIYAALLEGRYRGTIFRSDLDSPSPYNTYKHRGLPPGPICNPGIAALTAALYPARTPFLYFVSDGAGHTRFSVDLREHSRQVQAYRDAEQAHGNQGHPGRR